MVRFPFHWTPFQRFQMSTNTVICYKAIHVFTVMTDYSGDTSVGILVKLHWLKKECEDKLCQSFKKNKV